MIVRMPLRMGTDTPRPELDRSPQVEIRGVIPTRSAVDCAEGDVRWWCVLLQVLPSSSVAGPGGC